MLVCYLAGCAVGCWLRGKQKASRAQDTVSPAPEPEPRAAAGSSRAQSGKPARKPAARAKTAAKGGSRKKSAASGKDDLKLLSGVGPALEKKLNASGVRTFAQIAAWKKADIAEFDQKLNFKGRIEREKWVEQAKILAKGGETDFSRRASKGKTGAKGKKGGSGSARRS
ncbi:MAG: hypothetical protein Kow0032_18650 [Methyloligellaceae bacterium]